MTLNLSRHPHQQVPRKHRTERAFGHVGTCGGGRASAVGPRRCSFPRSSAPGPFPSWLSACGPTATTAGEGAAEAAGARAAPTLRGADAPGGGEAARGARAGTAGPRGAQTAPEGAPEPAVRPWGAGHLLLGLLSESRCLLFLKLLFSPIQEVKRTALAMPTR